MGRLARFRHFCLIHGPDFVKDAFRTHFERFEDSFRTPPGPLPDASRSSLGRVSDTGYSSKSWSGCWPRVRLGALSDASQTPAIAQSRGMVVCLGCLSELSRTRLRHRIQLIIVVCLLLPSCPSQTPAIAQSRCLIVACVGCLSDTGYCLNSSSRHSTMCDYGVEPKSQYIHT